MATRESEHLKLTLEDNDEFIGIETTAKNFEKVDAAVKQIQTVVKPDGSVGVKDSEISTIDGNITTIGGNIEAVYAAGGGNIEASGYVKAEAYLLTSNFSSSHITLESGVTTSVDSSWQSTTPLGARCTGFKVQIRGVVQFKYKAAEGFTQDLAKLKLNKTEPTDSATAAAFMPPPIGTIFKVARAAIIKSTGTSTFALALIGITTGNVQSAIRIYRLLDLDGTTITRVKADGQTTVALQLDMEYPIDLNNYN